MLCSMDKIKAACECDHPCKGSQISSEDLNCCKISIKEISNTNILELNNLSVSADSKYKFINNFLPVSFRYESAVYYNLNKNRFIPPPDIPILLSQILI